MRIVALAFYRAFPPEPKGLVIGYNLKENSILFGRVWGEWGRKATVCQPIVITGRVVSALCAISCLILTTVFELGTAIIPILLMRRLRLREVRLITQGHTAVKMPQAKT